MSQIVNCESLDLAQGNWQSSKNSLFDGLGFWETKAIKSANDSIAGTRELILLSKLD